MRENSHRSKRFRPLSEELRLPATTVEAGSHNLDRPTVHRRSATDLLVLRHEMHHDVALTETNYGLIQTMFRLIYDDAISTVIRHSASEWLKELFGESCHCHEILATYLSIKEQPSNVEADLVNILPDEYKSYYDTLAGLIDIVLPSSFLQYMVGKILMEICFSSRLIDDMLTWTPSSPARVPPDDSPDKRLDLLLQIWRSRLAELGNILKEQCHRQEFSQSLPMTFDILSEKHWLALDMDMANRIDQWLELECRDWMYQIAMEILPCSKRTEWYSQRKRFLEYMGRFTRRKAQIHGSENDFYEESEQERQRRKAWRDGRATISSPIAGRVKLSPVDSSQILASFGMGSATKRHLVISKKDKLVFVSGQPRRKDDLFAAWGMFRFDENGHVTAHTIAHEEFMRICKIRAHLAAATGFTCLSDMRVVVGLWSSDKGVDTSRMRQLVEAYSAGAIRLSLENVMWYMAGDFLRFYEFLLDQGSLEGFYINTSTKNQDGQNLSLEQVAEKIRNMSFDDVAREYTRVARTPQWFIFRSPIVDGLFVRMLPSATQVLTAIGEDAIVGRFRLLDRNEMEQTWAKIDGIEFPILALWKEV